MTARKSALLFTLLAAAVLGAVGIGLLLPSRQAGVLEPYSGPLIGLGYAGGKPDAVGGGIVLFKYFNDGSQTIELRPTVVLRQRRGGTGWVQEPSTVSNRFRIPARQVLTFEFRSPSGSDPWAAQFEKSTLPHPVVWFADQFKRLLGKRSSFPPFEAVLSTPLMQGLQPKVEPGNAPNSGPAMLLTNTSAVGPERHP